MRSQNQESEIMPFLSQEIIPSNDQIQSKEINRLFKLLNHSSSFLTIVKEITNKGQTYFKAVFELPIHEQLYKEGKAHFGERTSGGSTVNLYIDGQKGIAAQVKLIKIQPNLLREVLPNLQHISIQQSLSRITEKLDSIEQEIDYVIQGQRDDRAGLLDSGINSYRLAYLASNPETRKLDLNTAKNKLDEARFQIIRDIESIIGRINLPDEPTGFNMFFSNDNYIKNAKNVVVVLHNNLHNVLKATVIMAQISFELDEIDQSLYLLEIIPKFLPNVLAAQKKISKWLQPEDNVNNQKLLNQIEIAQQLTDISRQVHAQQTLSDKLKDASQKLTDGER